MNLNDLKQELLADPNVKAEYDRLGAQYEIIDELIMSEVLKTATKDWDIEAMAKAVIADDPDATAIQEDLLAALADVKAGKLARETQVSISPIAETRRKAGLSQRLFAERLGISVNTLKSWEQGKRQPSGSAQVLLKLITKKPELMADLA